MSNNFIDTISYTNKDFRSIWPELLDLVTDLTDKWDPNSSNESDPGVALLKLKAFIADKLNYNIDKNTLEAFPSSVTQRGNAQKLYDSLGYELRWYESAITDIYYKFINPINDSEITDETGLITFTVPMFAQLKDAEGKITYTALQQAVLDTENNTQTEEPIRAIEGPIESLTINGSETININNLDADYRLYFNESMIASNGIFINNIGSTEFWQKTFNLESTQLGRKVFKFGVLPTTNQCYIEFPQDAANLFDQGINIHYVISSGVSGNIKPKTLVEFAQDYSENGVDDLGNKYSLNKYVKVFNPNATTSGQDPESLEAAYINFQRTVNTFSTLVTLIDYYNAIMLEGDISNCIVTDRTTDFNASYMCKTKTLLGNIDKLCTAENLSMNAFNLALYALNNVPSVYDADTYNKTFTTSYAAYRDGTQSIEDYKSAQHDWVDVNNHSLLAFMFKNLLNLKGQVLTYQKVSVIEANQIIKNIKTKLYETYQSKNLTFGKDIPYEDIINTIKSADSRIKDFFYEDFTYDPAVMYSNNSAYTLNFNNKFNYSNTVNDLQIEIIARSILAGVTPLFMFDTSTAFSYTMKPVNAYTLKTGIDANPSVSTGEIYYNIDKQTLHLATTQQPGGDDTLITKPYSNISAITTQVDIPFDSSLYTLKTNETVFMYAPSFISTAQLSTYLYVCLQTSNSNLEEITEGSIYQLKPGEAFYVSETILETGQEQPTSPWTTPIKGIPTNANSSKVAEIKDSGKAFRVYGPGTIIKPSFDLKDGAKGGIQINGDLQWLTSWVNLESSKTIDIIEPNRTYINKRSTDPNIHGTKEIYCTWITDDLDNYLFNKSDILLADNLNNGYIEHILQQNEIFMYTNANKSDLILLQSGTKIKIPYLKQSFNEDFWKSAKPSATAINQLGVDALEDFWVAIPRTLQYFCVEELEIRALGSGVKLVNTSSNNPSVINNIPQKIIDPESVTWTVDDKSDDQHLPVIDLADNDLSWHIFSRLSVFATSETVFELKENQSICLFESQEINANKDIILVPKYVLGKGQSFSTDYVLITSGGIQQDVSVLKPDDTSTPLTFSVFNYQPIVDEKTGQNNLWNIYVSNNDKFGDAEYILSDDDKVSVSQPSGDTYATVVKLDSQFSDTDSSDKSINIKLSMKLSGLFNNSSIIPLIVEAPDNVVMQFNLPTEAVKLDNTNILPIINENDELDLKIYRGKLICLRYVAEGKFDITLSGIKKNDIIQVTLYQPKHYNSYNLSLFDNLYEMTYKVKTDSGFETLSVINDWDSSKIYSEFAVVKDTNNNFYVSKEGKEINKDKEPAINSDYWTRVIPQQFNNINNYAAGDLVYEFSADHIKHLEAIKLKIAELGSEMVDIQKDGGTIQLPIFDYTYDIPEEDLILDPLKPENFYHNKHVCNKITLTQLNSLDIQLARQSKQ